MPIIRKQHNANYDSTYAQLARTNSTDAYCE